MNRPPTQKQSFSSSDKTKIILVSIFLAVFLVILGLLVGLMLRQSGFRLSLPALQRQVTPTQISTLVSPEPTLVNPSQLDMLFLKSSVSPDQATITVEIRLTNKGANPITLTNDDLSVTPENGTSSPPSAVIPALPQQIAPGASLTISISFPKPTAPSVILKILDLTATYSL